LARYYERQLAIKQDEIVMLEGTIDKLRQKLDSSIP